MSETEATPAPDPVKKKKRPRRPPYRAQAQVVVTIGKGKRLRGDNIMERMNELVLFSGSRRFYINRTLAPLITVDGMPGRVVDVSLNPVGANAKPAPDAPKIQGGIIEIKRRRAEAAVRAGRPAIQTANDELENMMGPDFSQPIGEEVSG